MTQGGDGAIVCGKPNGEVVCPHCWYEFDIEQLLAIAQHRSLVGDPVLGPDAAQRFLPSRFTPAGHAIDAHGLTCPDFACPRCHLGIPHQIMEKPPLFFSMVGAPASGKSYLLATMVSQLRTVMPTEFAYSFGDADPACNQIINEYERILFHCPDEEPLVTLDKTEMHGSMYDEVFLDDMAVSLPRPFMFSLVPQGNHPLIERDGESLKQSVVLYDNAGEHFEPGMDSATNPGTQHLAMSHGLFFVFDPTKDVRFRRECKSEDPQITRGSRTERQEILLSEAITRIKRFKVALRSKKYDRPLVIVVSKYDVWRDMLPHVVPPFWQKLSSASTAAVDMDALMATSFAVRRLMARLCPEVVSTAESFASHVVYMPVSATGHSPTEDPSNCDSGLLLIRPRDIKPVWATAPLLYMLAHLGLLTKARRRARKRYPVATVLEVSGEHVFVETPHGKQPLEVPKDYLGWLLKCPETGKWFRMPLPADLRRTVR